MSHSSISLVEPLMGLGYDWPNDLLLLRHLPTGKYACFNHNGIVGVAAFTTEWNAIRFSEFVDSDDLTLESADFDTAREVALSRPSPVTALMLMDQMSNPVVHFVR
jgi:hypothetical protein